VLAPILMGFDPRVTLFSLVSEPFFSSSSPVSGSQLSWFEFRLHRARSWPSHRPAMLSRMPVRLVRSLRALQSFTLWLWLL